MNLKGRTAGRQLARIPKHHVRNGDIDIFFDRYGAGSPIIFLHGFPDTEDPWIAQIDDFAQDHLVIVPRLRGYPPSSVPDGVEAYALPVIAEDVKALAEVIDAGPVVLVGHDFGGALAQICALLFPELVSGLVLLNAPPVSTFGSVVHGDVEQQELSEYTLAYFRYQPGDDKNAAYVTRFIRDPVRRSEAANYIDANPIEGMMAYYKANFPRPPYRPQPPAGHVFNVSTLIVWGLEDEYFSPALLDGLALYFPTSLRIVTVGGAGHWVFRDAPYRVNAEIRSWLAMKTGMT